MAQATEMKALPAGQRGEAIRRDERKKIAARIREHAGTFAEFASDKETAVRLVALAVELDG